MEEKFIKIIVVEGMLEGEILKCKLEDSGIPCMLKFESIGRLMGITMNGLGKVQIMVPGEYEEEAREVIACNVEPT